MKIKNIGQINEFLKAVDKCEGGVKLYSPYGDIYNIKSKLSQYIAIGELLSKHGDELELYCDRKTDESNFYAFFQNNPDVV